MLASPGRRKHSFPLRIWHRLAKCLLCQQDFRLNLRLLYFYSIHGSNSTIRFENPIASRVGPVPGDRFTGPYVANLSLFLESSQRRDHVLNGLLRDLRSLRALRF